MSKHMAGLPSSKRETLKSYSRTTCYPFWIMIQIARVVPRHSSRSKPSNSLSPSFRLGSLAQDKWRRKAERLQQHELLERLEQLELFGLTCYRG